MLPGNTAADGQPTTFRGLYGYDSEGVWWEQPHFVIRAATDLQEELSSSVPLLMNIGINSGVASVGLHGVEASAGARWRYGASGTVVNIAARVRSLARDGSILMSEESVARVPNDFPFEDMGEHSLKNVTKPIRIYRLCGVQSL